MSSRSVSSGSWISVATDPDSVFVVVVSVVSVFVVFAVVVSTLPRDALARPV